MARSKLRNTNSALNRGQMVRLENDRIIPLPPPKGRCCRYDISDLDAIVLVGCSEITEFECDQFELESDDIFTSWENGKNCQDDPCDESKGRCCYGGSCKENVTYGGCTGAYGGDNSKCPDCNNPSEATDACCPRGSCCDGDSCFETIAANCGSQFTPNGSCPSLSDCQEIYKTDPTGGPCCPTDDVGACCVGTVGEGGSCSQTTKTQCAQAGGEFKGPNSPCPECGDNEEGLDICCPKTGGPSDTGACYGDCEEVGPPLGGSQGDCVRGERSCTQTTRQQCKGIFAGVGTDCYSLDNSGIWDCGLICPPVIGVCIDAYDCTSKTYNCRNVFSDPLGGTPECAGIFYAGLKCSPGIIDTDTIQCCVCDNSGGGGGGGGKVPCKPFGISNVSNCQIANQDNGECEPFCVNKNPFAPLVAGGNIGQGSNQIHFDSNKVGVQINGYITDDTTFVYERNVFARERLFGATLDGTTQPANQSFFGDKFDQSTIPDVDFFNQNERFSKNVKTGRNRTFDKGIVEAKPILGPFESNLVSGFTKNGNYAIEPKEFGDVVGGFTLGFVGQKIILFNIMNSPVFPVKPRIDTTGNTKKVFESQVNMQQMFRTNLIQHNGLKFTPDGEDNFENYIELMSNMTAVAGSDLKPLTLDHVLQNSQNQHNQLHQSFFVFDYSSKGSSGSSLGALIDTSLASGDRISSATLKLKIKSHFGERSLPSSRLNAQVTSLVGPLRCEPRKFEIVRVRKEIPYASTFGLNPTTRQFDPRDKYKRWDTPSGIGSADIDNSLRSEFTISEPMKQGDVLDIDITDLLQDAVDNRGSVLRAVLRPVSNYSEDGKGFILGNEGYVEEGGSGQGNHWFEFFDETGERPKVDATVELAVDSSDERVLAFRRSSKT